MSEGELVEVDIGVADVKVVPRRERDPGLEMENIFEAMGLTPEKAEVVEAAWHRAKWWGSGKATYRLIDPYKEGRLKSPSGQRAMVTASIDYWDAMEEMSGLKLGEIFSQEELRERGWEDRKDESFELENHELEVMKKKMAWLTDGMSTTRVSVMMPVEKKMYEVCRDSMVDEGDEHTHQLGEGFLSKENNRFFQTAYQNAHSSVFGLHGWTGRAEVFEFETERNGRSLPRNFMGGVLNWLYRSHDLTRRVSGDEEDSQAYMPDVVLVAVDLWGSGGSDFDDKQLALKKEAYGSDDAADFMVFIEKSLGKSPEINIGHSMGGALKIYEGEDDNKRFSLALNPAYQAHWEEWMHWRYANRAITELREKERKMGEPLDWLNQEETGILFASASGELYDQDNLINNFNGNYWTTDVLDLG